MKNLIVSIFLTGFLIFFGLFVFKGAAEAQNGVVPNLLNLPAPPPPNSSIEEIYKTRTEDFLDKNNPPKDDALVEDVLEYWENQNNSYAELGYNIKPSSGNLERILAEVEKRPESLTNFLNVLPENSETANLVKRFYDQALTADENFTSEWKSQVKRWLTYHSDHFSDELLNTAQKVGDADEYVTNQEELLALARVDWEKARPILERLMADDKQPVSQTLARWAFYRHALLEDDASDIEKYRNQLKAVVENKNASAGMRDLALDALVKEKEWRERDDWYVSLLDDETLSDLTVNGRSYTGLTTIMYYAPPEKYRAKMLELVRSSNPAVRGAAVRNLVMILDDKNPEIVRALLPWLENPDWVKETGGERQQLIGALANIWMPESVPGLIAVLNEKKTTESEIPPRGGVMSNSATAIIPNAVPREVYPYRSAAINALAKQKDARAISALRLVLPQVEEYERGNVVGALLASGGFSIPEQIEALESIARNVSLQNKNAETRGAAVSNAASAINRINIIDSYEVAPETTVNANSMSNSAPGGNGTLPFNPADIKVIMGFQLVNASEVGDELVTALVDRIEYLDAKDAELAFALRRIVRKWRGAAINSLLLRDLKNGKSETGAVVKLLSLRRELREKQSNEIFDARGGSAVALGIAACLLEDGGEYDALLAGDNSEARTAMLACARLIRAGLPVGKVAENLRHSNQTLALAAERYLESEDSPEARAAVLSLHPNEAKILGATTHFAAGESVVAASDYLDELFASVNKSQPFLHGIISERFPEVTANEKKLQKEVLETPELLGVYSFDKNFIRVYKDKAVFSWEQDAARYRERDLDAAEFNRFKAYLTSSRADEMPPFLSQCEECAGKEFLMLNRQDGRRIFHRSDRPNAFFAELGGIFDEMRKPPAKLHYWLEKNFVGLEILFADDNLQARALWRNADDLRVLLEDSERGKQIDKELTRQEEAEAEKIESRENFDYEKAEQSKQRRRARREFENFAWYKIEKNKFPTLVGAPEKTEYPPTPDGFPVQANGAQWKARTPNLEIRADAGGLYKISRGQFTKIQNGFYDKPLVTPNGQWAVATKYGGEDGGRLVRVNLTTGKELKIKLDRFPRYEAIAYVASNNKILVVGASFDKETESGESVVANGKYFWLDADTGIAQPVRGEIRPLAQQTFRPLQRAANADEFWAAIPDGEKNETQIGIYSAKTFTFKSLMKISQIEFDSMDMQTDEKENKIYFVYKGHLLALPVPKAGE